MNPKIPIIFLFTAFFCLLTNHNTYAQKREPTGIIKGTLVDAETKTPLIGANIMVANTILGAAADTDGRFIINKVPVGSYTLQFHYIGYESLSKTDVIVRPNRITYVNVELKISSIELKQVVVTGGYFPETDQQPVSITSFSQEEIRRAPGSAGDVSRIIMGLPSIAKVNDQSNSLIVRGGSPVENAFFIDNIEIPNINHFPTQGASGGPIGLVNVDFIKEVDFHTGGFSAVYGDKLSSIMNITFREGNRDEFDAQLDLNFSGFGGVAEGPLFQQKGSWLFSARRSYLDLLVKAIDIGTSVAPRYSDYQGKLVYDINLNHQLTLLGLWGDDHNNPDRKIAVKNDMIVYGNQDIYENTTGVNWRALWHKSGYSNTSIAYTSKKFKEDFFETNTGMHLVKNRSHEPILKFRNVNHFRLNKTNSIEFGVEAKHFTTDYNNFYAEYTDALGETVPDFTMDSRISANKFGAFMNYIAVPFHRLTTTLGVRADYFSYNKNSTISPRFALSYQLTDRTSIKGSTGLYYQNLPLILLSQNQGNKKLKDMLAIHYIFGMDHLLTETTKLSLEIYQKTYLNFPLDPTQPALFLIDELFYRYGFFFNHGQLIDKGKAFSRGVEIMLQKKLAKDFYGLASAAYFRTRYKGGDNIWRDRVFDNRLILSMQGGYKPNSKWEFSLRWIYAGGAPFTPFDIDASRTLHRAVLDGNRINAARYPAYHSLNVRFDRRFYFRESNLVFYLSVWNAYNRKNIATFFWNENENKQDVIYQWSLLPIFGIEFEF
ncbi:MAG: TonB-dependent receptor [Calditrichaeota bacterium]|nr:TonB-dependent receptor [Calditrichota bacterium]